MPRFFLSRTEFDPESGFLTLRGSDAHHLTGVLRMKTGDPVTVSDMQRTDYHCRIMGISGDGVLLSIESVQANLTEPPVSVSLFQSLPKGDKMDWIVQKSVELGVTEIIPVMSSRCVTRIPQEKISSRTERWQRIAEESGKQCGRGIVPTVRQPVSFSSALTLCETLDFPVFCYEGEGTEPISRVFDPIRDRLSGGTIR
ncbi:MAG: 16S rRNA (uracil(1498)-N(3))-methyltransferase, partial [Clostridia bacterium]|nr:16S rRNA (uracil(1498)-N(3))-methyltransferase [Clostridia bacterium]